MSCSGFVELSIEGMTCMSCVRGITDMLMSKGGVIFCKVLLEEGCGLVVFDKGVMSAEDVAEVVDDMGFDCKVKQAAVDNVLVSKFNVNGMKCKSCVGKIEKTLSESDAVQFVEVFLKEKSASVVHENKLSAESLCTIVNDCGFKCSIASNEESQSSSVEAKVLAPCAEKDSESSNVDMSKTISKASFNVGGMTCASCVASIERGLSQNSGIVSVHVGLMNERADIDFYEDCLTKEDIVEMIEDMGFTCKPLADAVYGEVKLTVKGMTCASCVKSIESHISKMAGICSINVSLSTETALVVFDHEITGARDIMFAIDDMGFECSLPQKNEAVNILSHASGIAKWRKCLLINSIFFFPVFTYLMVLRSFSSIHCYSTMTVVKGISYETFAMFAISTVMLAWTGKYFLKPAFSSLKHGMANMDVLVTLSALSAYTYSCVCIVVSLAYGQERKTFFEVPIMLLTFVSFGRFMENMAKGKTGEALMKLYELQSTEAMRVDLKDGTCEVVFEERLDSSLLKRGDIVRVSPGESFPVDGTVMSGRTHADESNINGEALPLTKEEGSKVLAGTVNIDGQVLVKASLVGTETTIAQIAKLVEEAQMSKAPIQRYADTVSSVFVPFIISISLVTFFVWLFIGTCSNGGDNSSPFSVALLYAITVLVVACPCALGLATPTAVMVGAGVGAKNGLLIKGGEPLESLSECDYVIFDKTGTLTSNKLDVIVSERILSEKEMSTEELYAIIAASEANSKHPVAKCLNAHCTEQARGVSFVGRDFQFTDGCGIECLVNKKSVVIGKPMWVAERIGMCDVSRLESMLSNVNNAGASRVLCAIDGHPAFVFGISEKIKESAFAAVRMLKQRGMEVAIASGDAEIPVTRVAQQLNIENVYHSLLPSAKEVLVRDLQSNGHKVIFVGDGVNDSPALARANVGLAIGCGADIAVEAADVVLVRDDPRDVCASIYLANKTVNRIYMNFFFAIIYNVIFLPVASGMLAGAGIKMQPVMASAAMMFSSVSVVVSSLLLKRFSKLDIEKEWDIDANNKSTSSPSSSLLSYSSSWLSKALHKTPFVHHKYQPLSNDSSLKEEIV
eukprot:Nk52_evm20s2622 gene=Nk52_evmTU20s2622